MFLVVFCFLDYLYFGWYVLRRLLNFVEAPSYMPSDKWDEAAFLYFLCEIVFGVLLKHGYVLYKRP